MGRKDRVFTPAACGDRIERNARARVCLAPLLAFVLQFSTTASLAATCDRSFSAVFNQNSPSVVRVFTVAIDPFSVTERVRTAVGTGVVVDDDGHIVTNAHIVFEANQVMISAADEELIEAEIIGMDSLTDLAVIKLDPIDLELPSARLGTSTDLSIGEEVMAIGFPFGIGMTATRGIISAVERVVPLSPFSWRAPFIQTDAAINPGNSGGPLLDSCGNVIGINTLTTEIGQNLSFAIPIDLVRELLPQLIEHGRVSRAWHGINGRIVPLPLAFALGIPPGFLVETVEPGSPAERIGLRSGNFPVFLGGEEFILGGDILISANGEPLTDMETVGEIAESLEVGDEIELVYLRDGEMMTATVTLPERPLLPGDVRRFRERRDGR